MLIEIEGPSGAGKTTLVTSLRADPLLANRTVIDAARLEQNTNDIGWRLGDLMRQHDHPIDSIERVLLYCARTAARARLALSYDSDVVVLCDRLRLSLQVATCSAGLPQATRTQLVDLALRRIQPDLVILLDVSHPTHRRRLARRGHQPEPPATFDRSRRLFAAAFEQHTGPRSLVDTTRLTPEQVRRTAIQHLLSIGAAA